MTCEAFAARLTAYTLGELPEAEAAAAREHVAGCDRCTTLMLRDRELVSRLRAAATPAPPAVHQAVRLALRREREQRRRRLVRRLVGVAAAVVLAGVVTFTPLNHLGSDTGPTTASSPAPRSDSGLSGPLAAAWSAYHAPVLPLERVGAGDPLVLGFAPELADLEASGLRRTAAGMLHLAGRPAHVTEYRTAAGDRLAVFRWKGTLPSQYGDYPSGGRPELRISRTGLTSSAWWDDGQVVWCVVGDLEATVFDHALDRLRGRA